MRDTRLSALAAASSLPVLTVVSQHAEEAAILHGIRSRLSSAPNVKMHQLRRFDDRIAAHLDGLSVAGEVGWKLCESALERTGAGETFVITVRAIEDSRRNALEQLLAIAEAAPTACSGLIAAFGWVSAKRLEGIVKGLLRSDSFRRLIGLEACALHQVDPGEALRLALADPDLGNRAKVLRLVGICGRRDLVTDCRTGQGDNECDRNAAWAAVLLGERSDSAAALLRAAVPSPETNAETYSLALQVQSVEAAHRFLKELASSPEHLRWLIRGSGVVGDAAYVPWLISNTSDDQIARIAGEAFSLITGADLALLDLERKPPKDIELDPNDEPNDADIAIDEDDGLPWPDSRKVEAWWHANEHRFQKGVRYFMGQPVTKEHCIHVLKTGYQRQRILAAQYLCLLEPGTPLFNTSAPAWRQQRLLAAM